MTMLLAGTEPQEAHQEARSSERPAGQRPLPGMSRLLHWFTATLVLFMLGSGVMMKQLGGTATADMLYTLHKTCGIGVLGLALLRVAFRGWAWVSGRWPDGAGARAVHGALYACLIAVPLLGWAGVSDFGARGILFGYSLPPIWPEGAGHADSLFLAHALLAFLMFGLVFVHVGIAVNDYIQRGTNSH